MSRAKRSSTPSREIETPLKKPKMDLEEFNRKAFDFATSLSQLVPFTFSNGEQLQPQEVERRCRQYTESDKKYKEVIKALEERSEEVTSAKLEIQKIVSENRSLTQNNRVLHETFKTKDNEVKTMGDTIRKNEDQIFKMEMELENRSKNLVTERTTSLKRISNLESEIAILKAAKQRYEGFLNGSVVPQEDFEAMENKCTRLQASLRESNNKCDKYKDSAANWEEKYKLLQKKFDCALKGGNGNEFRRKEESQNEMSDESFAHSESGFSSDSAQNNAQHGNTMPIIVMK